MSLPTLDPDKVAADIGRPFDTWQHDCHSVSLAIVKSEVLPDLGFPIRRVARGSAAGVMGQHSWIVLGDNCYARGTPIVDPTLWSYRTDVTGIYIGNQRRYRHTPHGGHSTIWDYGKPPEPRGGDGAGQVLELEAGAFAALSPGAQHFLKMCGPLDWHGWSFLCNAPVRGWPAAEIIGAMADNRQLSPIIPVDRLGMLTDRNPQELYLP